MIYSCSSKGKNNSSEPTSVCQPPIRVLALSLSKGYNYPMLTEREIGQIRQYFTQVGTGNEPTFNLEVVVPNESGKGVISLGEDVWTSEQANKFTKHCINSTVPSASQRIERYIEEFSLLPAEEKK